jgi:hypothetical protein
VVTRIVLSPWASDESAPQPPLPGDEAESWQNWVAAVPAQNLVWVPAPDDLLVAPASSIDDDIWQNWSAPVPAQLLLALPLGDLSDALVPPPPPLGVDEDYWQNWVVPVQADTNAIALRPPWFGGWTEDIFSQLQEDFLVYLIQDENLNAPQYRPDTDDYIAVVAPDEDTYLAPILTQLGLRPYVYQPPQQAFTDTEEPLPALYVDEIYRFFIDPFLANQPLGVPAYASILRAGNESSDFVPQPTGAKDDDFLVLHIGPRLELTLKGRLKFRIN